MLFRSGGTNSELQISGQDDNLTVGGDLIVQGNMAVYGTTSTIDTENLLFEDPLLLLGHGSVGPQTSDSGLIISRGSGMTQGIIWDESESQFALITTTQSSITENSISISGYSDLRAKDLEVSSIKITKWVIYCDPFYGLVMI